MNRLILLGNGFDLAHGLKTSYNDFIKWYLKQCLKYAQANRVYDDDPLIKVTFTNERDLKFFSHANIHNVSDFVDYFYLKGFKSVLTSSHFMFDGWNNHFFNPFKITIKLNFFKTLVESCSSSTWVEIENVYYKELKSIFNNDDDKRPKTDADKRIAILKLNEGFAHLINMLQSYLKSIGTNSVNLEYKKIINAPFAENEFTQLYPGNTSIGETMILNFNYTTTVSKYLGQSDVSQVDLNFIHGMLDMDENPVIFGFGDEMDKVYQDFETHETMGQFDYFKSFLYLQTSNYYNLLRFIQSNDYQVYILGHSCGLSDRTMLNMIFEHDNCKSIKIFYHQQALNKNNYIALTQEIARHFKDKQAMRGKIVSLEKSKPMPQVAL